MNLLRLPKQSKASSVRASWTLLSLFLLGSAAIGSLLAFQGSSQGEPPHRAGEAIQPPNILFLLADDLGFADLGSYGNTEIQTPNLDRLAREGVRFTQFYSNGSVCTPTRASLLTGKYPQRFGAQLREGVRHGSLRGLPDEVPTLPQLLGDRGYETMHLGKWHIGHAQRSFRPLGKGYDSYFGFLHPKSLPTRYRNPALQRNEGQPVVFEGHLTDLLTQEAQSLIRARKDSTRPFFMSLWYFAPHLPLTPPQRWAERYENSDSGRYAALVSSLDESVGILLRELAASGLAENTIVVFMSDNGGATRSHKSGNGPLRGGKNRLTEGGIRVPLIVRWPQRIHGDLVRDQLVAGFDLVPTLVELAGIDFETDWFDGQSVAPLLLDPLLERPRSTRQVFWDDREPGVSFVVRRGGMKLLHENGRSSLFDLGEDLEETIDLARQHPSLVKEMEDGYRQWRLDVSRIPVSMEGFRGSAKQLGPAIDLVPPGGSAVVSHPYLNPLDGELSFGSCLCPQPNHSPTATREIAVKGDAWSLSLTPNNHLSLRITESELVSLAPLPSNQCSYVAFSYAHPGLASRRSQENGKMSLFVNGVLQGSGQTKGAILPENAPVVLGSRSDRESPLFGKLGPFEFFSSALSAEEFPGHACSIQPPTENTSRPLESGR